MRSRSATVSSSLLHLPSSYILCSLLSLKFIHKHFYYSIHVFNLVVLTEIAMQIYNVSNHRIENWMKKKKYIFSFLWMLDIENRMWSLNLVVAFVIFFFLPIIFYSNDETTEPKNKKIRLVKFSMKYTIRREFWKRMIFDEHQKSQLNYHCFIIINEHKNGIN